MSDKQKIDEVQTDLYPEDLPVVQEDKREPLARSLKRAGITADDEVVGEDRKLRDTEAVAQDAKPKSETKKA